MKKIVSLIPFTFIIVTVVFAQDDEARNSQEKNFDYFREKTSIQDPFKLRDPFKRDLKKGKKKEYKKGSKKSFLRNGTYTNLSDLGVVDLGAIQIVGILVGESRRALARVAGRNNELFTIREGMKIGKDGAEVRAILPGGVVIVEKLRNIYDQDEYLETIIPLTPE